MEAGEKLNALISERIFGIKVIMENYMDREGRIWTPYIDRELFPDYSGDISPAWKIVEKTGLFRNHHLVLWQDKLDGAWHISETDTGEILNAVAVADTAPLAICWAALKLVGEEA